MIAKTWICDQTTKPCQSARGKRWGERTLGLGSWAVLLLSPRGAEGGLKLGLSLLSPRSIEGGLTAGAAASTGVLTVVADPVPCLPSAEIYPETGLNVHGACGDLPELREERRLWG